MQAKRKVEPTEAQDGLVERFHKVLVESIREKAPAYLDGRFTVAEIYQFLVPYRTHRDRLGLAMNGDYEDILLRLLAGDGEYLILESDPARDRIREELGSRNPHTGIYREFAAVEVRLNAGRLPENGGKGASPPAPERPVGSPVEPLELLRGDASANEPSPSDGKASTAQEGCPDCGKPLPRRDSLRFCPHCGTNTRETPCRNCGEVLDRDWRFCLACGVPTAG